jgi:hypothetical protein
MIIDQTDQEVDYRLSPPFGVVAEPDTRHGRLLTPRSLALAAACLLFRQDHWACADTASRDLGHDLGRLSLLGSLCLAAGGNFNEDGNPTPPEEESAAEVLECTCNLLASHLSDRSGDSSPARRLDEMRPVTSEDTADIQRLLATVHGVHPPL